MKEELIKIERLAFGGSGVGRINGKVCFVPYSVPGDVLLVEITSEKRSYLIAKLLEIKSPSPERNTPPCPLFGVCGGCGWQHITYQEQLKAKRQILVDALSRGAGVAEERIAEIISSSEPYGYRSRVQFKLYYSQSGLRIGFFRTGTHYVEDATDGCLVAAPRINQALQNFRKVLANFPDPDALPQIDISAVEKGAVAIIHYIGKEPERAVAFFKKRLNELAPLDGLYLKSGRKDSLTCIAGSGHLEYTMPADEHQKQQCAMLFRPGGFSQVNIVQNRAILELVRKFAAPQKKDRILDLYCGNGNFSIPLAEEVASITGIEEYKDSIAAAIDNCRRNEIHNARFFCLDTVTGIRKLQKENVRYETVILDPPRSGAADAAAEICRLSPDRIIYISCDPGTLARDCGLMATGGYQVEIAVPVDMFPQTYHLESVTLLKRKTV